MGNTSLDNGTYNLRSQPHSMHCIYRSIDRVESKGGTVLRDYRCYHHKQNLSLGRHGTLPKLCPNVWWEIKTDSCRKFRFILDHILNQAENNGKNLNGGLPVPQHTFFPKVREYQLLLK